MPAWAPTATRHPYPLLTRAARASAVHPGWPEMGVPEDGPDGQEDVHGVLVRRGQGRFHRQRHVQHADL